MALATRCPHCQTAFRVASDQLKLRAGLVRCGTCKEIFNGIENLLHPDEDIVAATAAPVQPIPTVEESVVATRRVRGDDTRFADLIAEVDRADAPAGSGPAPSPVVAAPESAASVESFEPADAQAPDVATSAAKDSDSLWQAIDDAPFYAAFETDQAAAGADPAGKPAAAGADADADAASVSDGDAHADGDADVDTDGEITREVGDDAVAAVAAEADFHTDAEADSDAQTATEDADIDGAASALRDSAVSSHADDDAATAEPSGPDDDEAQARPVPSDADPLLPTLPSLLRTAAVADDEPASASFAPVAPPAGKNRKPQPATAPIAVAPAAPADDLPDFVTREEAREDRHRARRPLLICAAVLLTLALAAQGLYAGRTTLAASFPPLRPLLDQGCRLLGCSVGLPMQIESVSIESSDFQPVPGSPDQFLLTVLLRNRSSTVQAWPTIELSLNDATDKAVGRRLIAPRDYLPAGQTAVRGFSAGSEQAVRLVFDLSRLKASGYRVYVFYP